MSEQTGQYDLDTSGGIMEEIQALIAPPQSEESKRRQAAREAALNRRTIRTVNRDSCDACKEGGDLLCCDTCPTSLHLQCCDPPLEEEDVLTGDWVCVECKNGVTKRPEFKRSVSCSMSEKSVGSSRSSSPIDSELGLNPFEQLTAMFRHKNPREFQLPAQMQQFAVMPGDRKRRTPVQAKKKEDEAQRLCFICSKTSRIGDLIYCDFCPCVYHRDCLMPPLAQDPIGLWICPNHPENFHPGIRTPKYSQRVQVVEEMRSNINHNTIKLQFFNRAKKERILMNREEHQPKKRRTCNVPDIVKAQYENPPAEMVPDQYGYHVNQPLEPHMRPITLPTTDEKEQWLKSVVDLQCAIAGSLETSQGTPSSSTTPSSTISSKGPSSASVTSTSGGRTTGTNASEAMDIDKEQTTTERQLKTEQTTKKVDSSSSPSSSEVTSSSSTVANKSSDRKSDTGQQQQSAPSATSITTIKEEAQPSAITAQQTAVESSTINKASTVTTTTTTSTKIPSVGSSTSSGSQMVSSISSEILKDPTLSQLDERLVRILAFQRLQQLVEKKSQQIPKISQPGITEKKIHLQTTETKNSIAVLSPLNGLGPACYMRYKSFNTGQGADMDLCLSNYGFCNYVSGKHATIFYDKETRQFELLNYSEHGTIVDNVLYSCDFSEKPKHNVTSSNAKFDTGSKYLDMQQRRKKPPIGRTTRGLGTEFITRACNCRASASSLIGGSGAGWEGTAVLHHGSYVKFGCLHFVFSIVECASKEQLKAVGGAQNVESSKKPISNHPKEITTN